MNKILVVSCGFLCCLSCLFSGCTTLESELEIKQFSVDSEIINAGEQIVLHWLVTGADIVSIDNNIGQVDPIGSKTLTVNRSTTFTLTASDDNTTVTKTVIVYVKGISSPEDIIIDTEAYTQAKRDPYTIEYLFIYDDYLDVVLRYSGGCDLHVFTLYAQEEFMESDPVQVNLVLSHDAHNDTCEALITKSMRFDLSLLKQRWQTMYQQGTGEITLNLEEYDQPIQYQFEFDLFSSLNVSIRADKDTYQANEIINISVFVENKEENDILIEFPDAQVADFQCTDASDNVIYVWSSNKMFAQVITPVTLPAGTMIELFNESWDPTSTIGTALEPGTYTLQAWLPGFYYQDEESDTGKTMGSKIYSDPIQITIV